MPMIIEVQWKPFSPTKSGMKPAPMAITSGGSGPTDWPCSSQSVSPRKTSIPASVTMKEGIF